jgi:hypothetical protein
MTFYRPLPSAEELWHLFDYKPLTGELIYRVDTMRKKAGDVACYPRPNGYRSVSPPGQRHLQAHRVVWAWVTGQDPIGHEVDHRDLNKGRNAWGNLRCCTHPQNMGNIPARGGHGRRYHPLKGVNLSRSLGRYEARIGNEHLGTFDTPEEAHAAYCAAAQERHGEFWRAA